MVLPIPFPFALLIEYKLTLSPLDISESSLAPRVSPTWSVFRVLFPPFELLVYIMGKRALGSPMASPL